MFLFPLFYVIREFHRFLHRGKAKQTKTAKCFIYAPTEVSIEFSDGKHRQAVSPGLKKARAS